MIFVAFLIILSLSAPAFTASPPILYIPLASQLVPSNPALSSVYSIHSSSALLVNTSESLLALRIPPAWSFSIGLEWNTFLPASDDHDRVLLYSASLEDGSDLPEWMFFDPDTYVFGGFTPEEPQTIHIVVTASTSSHLTASDMFILIISSYDLYVSSPLLTRNVTAGQHFSIALNDFRGIHLTAGADTFNRKNKNASFDIELAVDTAVLSSWLSYDPKSRVLKGTPPNTSTAEESVIGATISASHLGRSLSVSSNFTLAVIPPAFSNPVLPSILIYPGEVLSFNLLPYLNSVAVWNVLATIPSGDAHWLSFDPVHLSLNGSVPVNASGDVQVTFIAKDEDRRLHSSTQLKVHIIQYSNTPHMATTHNRKELLIVLGTVLGAVVFITFVFTVLIISYHHRLRLSTATLSSKPTALACRRTLIHRLRASLTQRFLPSKGTIFAAARRAMPEFPFFRQLLSGSPRSFESTNSSSSRPPILKGQIGVPIAVLRGSTGLLADFVNVSSTEELVPIRAGDMKKASSRHNYKKSSKIIFTPTSTLSHIAVKGSLEGMDSTAWAVVEDGSDGAETLADRKAQLLSQEKPVTNIALSPSGRAIVNIVPPASMDKTLPSTPDSTERPSAPTPTMAMQLAPVSSLTSDPSATGAEAMQSLLESTGPVVIPPLSKFGSRPLPVPEATLTRHKSLRTTATASALRYNHACQTSSPLRPPSATFRAPHSPSSTNVPNSLFSEPATPPPSMPLPAPPMSNRRRAPFGESSQESITSFVAEDTVPRLLTPLVSRAHQRTRSYTTHNGSLMTPRAARDKARLDMQLELAMDNFKLDEFSEGVLSEVGIKEEEINGELASRGPSPFSEEYGGSAESDRGATLPTSPSTDFNRVYVVDYLPDTPFYFKIPLERVAKDDELLVLCAYGKYGQPPPWACFDGTRRTFRGITPKLKPGKRLRVRLNVWNLSTGEVVGMCEIRVTPASEKAVVVGQAY